MKRRLLTSFLLAAAVALPAAAEPKSVLDDPRFVADAARGLSALYDMSFAAAHDTFAQVSARHSGHPVGPFLESLLPWWALQLEPDDSSQDETFLAAMDEVLKRCDRRLAADRDDRDGLFFRAGAYAFRGKLHADRRRFLRASRDGVQALRALRHLAELEPDNDDLYFGIGLFDYLADVAPRKHKILRPFAVFFPKGDRERGLAELERAMSRGRFVPTEVAYTLLQLQFLFEDDMTASRKHVAWLRSRHPDNSLFHLYEGRIAERLGKLNDANRVFHEILHRHAAGQSGYTDAVAERALYLLARVEMRWRRFDVALAQIDRLDRLTGKRGFHTEYRVLARLRRGMVLDALGRREEAKSCYRQVLRMESESNTHERAREYLKKPYRSG